MESRRDESLRDRASHNAQSRQECVRLTLNDVLAHRANEHDQLFLRARRDFECVQTLAEILNQSVEISVADAEPLWLPSCFARLSSHGSPEPWQICSTEACKSQGQENRLQPRGHYRPQHRGAAVQDHLPHILPNVLSPIMVRHARRRLGDHHRVGAVLPGPRLSAGLAPSALARLISLRSVVPPASPLR